MVRILTADEDWKAAIALYRRVEKPPLFYTLFHAVEIRTGILHRAFSDRQTLPPSERRGIARRRDAAFARLSVLVERGTFRKCAIEMEDVLASAEQLAVAYAQTFGLRTLDIIHVAAALLLETELFLTTDLRQIKLAKAKGLNVISV